MVFKVWQELQEQSRSNREDERALLGVREKSTTTQAKGGYKRLVGAYAISW